MRYICVETGFGFDDLDDICEEMNISPREVLDYCNGLIPNTQGYHWYIQYSVDDEN